jgi:hypothetical protein
MIDTLRDFVTRAEELGIEYMVTGSFAMSAYGEIRFTRDIDIVIKISDNDIEGFCRKFEPDHYISDRSVRDAVERRSMFNIISNAHGGKIDCIVLKNTEFEKESFARRYKEAVAGVKFWTTTREDLIVAKLQWAKDTFSEMQIRDVVNLTESEYDADHVSAWIEKLGLHEIWGEVESWKIRRQKQGQ